MSEEGREDVYREENEEPREVAKFIILVLILTGAVAAVAVSRPLVFDGIVPAVLGWDAPAVDGGPPTREPTETPAAVEESDSPATPTATTTAIPPTATPRIHVVQPGDNLTKIGERYGVTVDAIMQANQMTNPHRIYPGQRLVIPDR